MKKLIIHRKLEAFLRKHKCLTVFKQNVLKEIAVTIDTVNSLVLKDLQEGNDKAISNAFYWAESNVPKHTPLTPHDFWSALHYKWDHEFD